LIKLSATKVNSRRAKSRSPRTGADVTADCIRQVMDSAIGPTREPRLAESKADDCAKSDKCHVRHQTGLTINRTLRLDVSRASSQRLQQRRRQGRQQDAANVRQTKIPAEASSIMLSIPKATSVKLFAATPEATATAASQRISK
jgi:hypothetical protein